MDSHPTRRFLRVAASSNMDTTPAAHFDRQYQLHLKHLKLKGLQPKTIDAYARAIRRIGGW